MTTEHEARKMVARILMSYSADRARWLDRARQTKKEHPDWPELITSQVRYARETHRRILRYLKTL